MALQVAQLFIDRKFAILVGGDAVLGAFRTRLCSNQFAVDGGQFVLRIDDTDLAPSTAAFEQGIEDDLTWLGLVWDERHNQSKRFDRYEAAADRLKAGQPVAGLSLVSALWCRYCAGTSDSGRTIAPNDANAARLKEAALRAREEPAAFLALSDIFGDTGKSPVFADAFAHNLRTVWEKGARGTLEAYLAGSL